MVGKKKNGLSTINYNYLKFCSQEYAKSMAQLATEHWDKKHKDDIKHSRNAWIVHQIKDYFTNVYISRRQKELREREINELSCDMKFSEFQTPYNLLDVGSCYNPFKNIDDFSTIAIDICPANVDVFKCDFINLTVNKFCNNKSNNSTMSDYTTEEEEEPRPKRPRNSEPNLIESMIEESFDVVVFSLLLEYIPCSKLRFQCCVKAYQLLKYEGILIIITPDSKHQTSPNVKIIKQWKIVLESIGFKRTKYEKLTHIHCMVFRKSCLVKKFKESSSVQSELLIPQDIQ